MLVVEVGAVTSEMGVDKVLKIFATLPSRPVLEESYSDYHLPLIVIRAHVMADYYQGSVMVVYPPFVNQLDVS
jgi:hypothetical protein